jgi:tetratricopeptide (TPR) repeat protein
MMPTEKKCPDCGAAIPAGAPPGFCPRCELAGARELTPPGSPAVVATEQPGDHIGRYKLLEKIGEGGYGIVYMAEQSEPIRRRVALKVVKLGMDTKQVIARFEAERQALALMNHPNIAKVLDAGSTDTGRPYFVMELVRGIRITHYCDENHLSTRDRIELFLQVSQAAQHAHQKGIIHRDLKPSNILVTMLDGRPVPKVIDFGIAKATQQPLTEKTLFTSFQQFIGTPAYMSPEQAEMGGADVDTRSDIYSLGVLLYELLTGNTPSEQKELLQAGFDELRRLIREQEPLRPSTRLSTLAAADLTRVAKRHRTEPSKLLHLIRGDLDWIVMKCLEKDRTRRYATADALAEDLRRHLNDEPVAAAAPSAFYRMAKFVRRHRRGVSTAVTLMLVLAAGFVWQTVQVRSMERRTRLVAKFVEKTLADLRLSVLKGRDTTLVQEVLNQALARLPRELRNERAAQAHLRLTMGFIYHDLRDYAGAEAVFRDARETYAALYGKENPGVAACTFGLALVSLKQGRAVEAEARARAALVTGGRVFGRDYTVVGHALTCLAAALEAQNRLEEAEASARDALVIGRRLSGEDALIAASSLSILGKVLSKQERPAEAEPILREAIDLRRKLLGSAHPEVAELLKVLAGVLERQGKAEAAASASSEANRILEWKTSVPPK